MSIEECLSFVLCMTKIYLDLCIISSLFLSLCMFAFVSISVHVLSAPTLELLNFMAWCHIIQLSAYNIMKSHLYLAFTKLNLRLSLFGIVIIIIQHLTLHLSYLYMLVYSTWSKLPNEVKAIFRYTVCKYKTWQDGCFKSFLKKQMLVVTSVKSLHLSVRP